MRLFFATDFHGSTRCFKKFINSTRTKLNPDILVVGGDITGKLIVPVISKDDTWRVHFEGVSRRLESRESLDQYLTRLEDIGAYPVVCELDEWKELKSNEERFDARIRDLQVERLDAWLDFASERLSGQRLIVNAGNDDPFYIDQIVEESCAEFAEGKAIELGEGLTLLSTGYSNLSPWNCPRDVSENELERRIEGLVGQVNSYDGCVFNFHCPPKGSGLDRAKKLDVTLRPSMSGLGAVEANVGSIAVREAIEKYQPLVSLHGHIHEQHGYVRVGRTLVFNPGSDYQEGKVQGVFLEFGRSEVISFGMTREQIPSSLAEGRDSVDSQRSGVSAVAAFIYSAIRRWIGSLLFGPSGADSTGADPAPVLD